MGSLRLEASPMTRPVCVITGASGMLGKAVSAKLCASHDIVALVHSRSAGGSTQIVEQFSPISDDALPKYRSFSIQADLLFDLDLQHAAQLALAKFGRL